MAAGLLCLHSERVVLLTGTPFNNSCQDIATLMTFINPSDKAAELDFWKDVTSARAARRVVKRLQGWTTLNVLRREKDVIAHLLPDKRVRKEEIRERSLEE